MKARGTVGSSRRRRLPPLPLYPGLRRHFLLLSHLFIPARRVADGALVTGATDGERGAGADDEQRTGGRWPDLVGRVVAVMGGSSHGAHGGGRRLFQSLSLSPSWAAPDLLIASLSPSLPRCRSLPSWPSAPLPPHRLQLCPRVERGIQVWGAVSTSYGVSSLGSSAKSRQEHVPWEKTCASPGARHKRER